MAGSETPKNRSLDSDIRRATTILQDVDEFLTTPVHYDPFKRNKVPFALRFRGSNFVGMIPTLLLTGIWTSVVVYVSLYHHTLAVDNVLITVTGLITSLALGFRVNSAYERWTEGMKYWSQLSKVIRSTARVIWWSIPDKPIVGTDKRPLITEETEQFVKEELLTKATAVRTLVGFAYALKHHLRGEFGTDWDDLRDLVGFLPTYGRLRSELEKKYTQHPRRRCTSSTFGSLQTRFLWNIRPPLRRSSNRIIKATIAHGNLPLELLSFFGCYVDLLESQGRLPAMLQGFFMEQSNQLQEILAGCERVLQTPLPLAFNISIAQITWVFILLLPFQLVGSFKWATIPACIAAAYMFLGLSHLSFEIENPFGMDGNDLPLDRMCDVLTTDVDVICAHKLGSSVIEGKKWLFSEENRPLLPVVKAGIEECLESMTVDEIREALRLKVERVSGEAEVEHAVNGNADDDGVGVNKSGHGVLQVQV